LAVDNSIFLQIAVSVGLAEFSYPTP